jgi:hypothetical protein
MATPPTFSAGQVLTSGAMNDVGLWLVLTQDVGSTPVSSVTVFDAFNADFDDYRVTWSNGNMNGVADVGFQLGGLTAGYYGSQYFDSYTGVNGINRWNNTANWQRIGGGDTNFAMFQIDLYSPFLVKQTQMTFQAFTAGAFTTFGAGLQVNASSATDFVLTGAAGGNTLANGTIRVYGYRK